MYIYVFMHIFIYIYIYMNVRRQKDILYRIDKYATHINLHANNTIKAPKGVSQTNKVAASGQPQAPVVKALPVIPKKGVGTGVESIQKHTQQQQNFLMKASIASTGSKMPPTDVQQASTLPPIGSNVIPVGKVGTGPQYGSTVGASTR
jgi:hypothetical protein